MQEATQALQHAMAEAQRAEECVLAMQARARETQAAAVLQAARDAAKAASEMQGRA